MRFRNAALVVSAVTAALAFVSSASGMTSTSFLINDATNRCLAVQGSANYNGAPAFQYDCEWGWPDQRWWITPAGKDAYSTDYTISNRNTGKCLAVQASANFNGAPAFQYDCIPGYTDQHWRLVWRTLFGKQMIENVATRKCLAIQSSNDWNGSPAIQHDCRSDYRDQGWYIAG
jgi:hypothetical protein